MNFLSSLFNKLTISQNVIPNNEHQNVQIPQDILLQFFNMSAKFISQSKNPVNDSMKLKLYGYYKQGTVGNCNIDKPAIYDFIGKSKWTAWNQLVGMTKQYAQKCYIVTALQADNSIQKKMCEYLSGNQIQEQNKNTKGKVQGGIKNVVDIVDYSNTYSHPYFKRIQKNELIKQQQINHQLLLTINNNPKVYPLHFAIDKQRVDLVQKFLNLLTIQQILSMKDQQGTTILEYAQLIQNQNIIKLVNKKLVNK